MALCLNCGDLKFGAICDCPVCKVASSGEIDLDITFSDHVFDQKTLAEFGSVVKAIAAACPDDPQVRYWAFLQYVSTYHPTILRIELKDGMAERVGHVLAMIDLPPVTIRKSWRNLPPPQKEDPY